jgi:hypothetical protein
MAWRSAGSVGVGPVPDDTGSVAISPHAPSISVAVPTSDTERSLAACAMKKLSHRVIVDLPALFLKLL